MNEHPLSRPLDRFLLMLDVFKDFDAESSSSTDRVSASQSTNVAAWDLKCKCIDELPMDYLEILSFEKFYNLRYVPNNHELIRKKINEFKLRNHRNEEQCFEYPSGRCRIWSSKEWVELFDKQHKYEWGQCLVIPTYKYAISVEVSCRINEYMFAINQSNNFIPF